ncbi:MAG: hypothetical protein LBQ60_15910 [Bacteroidales bacterium]|jgi:hypothetical protein|nr:hypothetical protein [Bacteroidales bacterium]
MKFKFLFIAVLSLTILFCADAKENELKGTWKLISQNGKDVTGKINQIKFITENNFIWANFDDEGEIKIGAGGKFSIDGNTFTETIVMAFTVMKSFLGQKFTYEYELKNNKLHMKGKIGNSPIEEVWERMD